MLNATQAKKWSDSGAEALRRRSRAEDRAHRREWLRTQAEKSPDRISEAEKRVKYACAQGEQIARTWIFFVKGTDYEGEFGRDRLCKPHQDLLRHFEDAGYTIEMKYNFEPHDMYHATESYEVILKW